MSPKVDPLVWAQLPADAQRMLSGWESAAKLNLLFNDDGTLATSPARAGETLGLLLMEHYNAMDSLREATIFTEWLTRKALG